MRGRSAILLLGIPLLGVCAAAAMARSGTGDDPDAIAFFENAIRPLLAEKCQKCHGSQKTQGGLRLTSRHSVLEGGDSGPAAVAGRPRESLIVEAVEQGGELKMPPQGKLSAGEIERLRRWIAMGVPWPEASAIAPTAASADREASRSWWSFQPVRASAPPKVKDTAWPRTEIDRFILSGLEARGMKPARSADRRTLIRRATFDLIGLPPTPEEVEAFLADGSPDAFEKVADRLLASPAYGERWGRHWLDVVRYADARDLIQLPAESDFREAWRYRDWVVAAFNRDMPYAEFVRFQVAGDLLPPPRPGGINKDGIVATGLLAIADFVPGDVDKEQMIADYVNDQVDVVSRAFLGLSIACARCHDHKFDPISAEDYYALAGIFFSTSLVPGPVPGNTPLVRVPLLSKDELARLQTQDAADKRRRAELEQQLPDAADRAYLAAIRPLIAGQTARYLAAACESRARTASRKVEPDAGAAREGEPPGEPHAKARTEPRPPDRSGSREGEPPGEPHAKARTERRPPDRSGSREGEPPGEPHAKARTEPRPPDRSGPREGEPPGEPHAKARTEPRPPDRSGSREGEPPGEPHAKARTEPRPPDRAGSREGEPPGEPHAKARAERRPPDRSGPREGEPPGEPHAKARTEPRPPDRSGSREGEPPGEPHAKARAEPRPPDRSGPQEGEPPGEPHAKARTEPRPPDRSGPREGEPPGEPHAKARTEPRPPDRSGSREGEPPGEPHAKARTEPRPPDRSGPREGEPPGEPHAKARTEPRPPDRAGSREGEPPGEPHAKARAEPRPPDRSGSREGEPPGEPHAKARTEPRPPDRSGSREGEPPGEPHAKARTEPRPPDRSGSREGEPPGEPHAKARTERRPPDRAGSREGEPPGEPRTPARTEPRPPEVTQGHSGGRAALDPGLVAAWVEYLGRVQEQTTIARHPILCDAAAGRLAGPPLARAAEDLERALADRAAYRESGSARLPAAQDLWDSCVMRFRADDPYLLSDSNSRVSLWPNRSGRPADARPAMREVGPIRATVAIDGRMKSVLRFDGRSLLEVPRAVPPAGSLFAVFRTAAASTAGRRLVGWEDSDVGKHGLGLLVEPGGRLQAVLRNDGKAGDLADARAASGFEIVAITWGPGGTALHRNGTAAGSNKGIESVSSDPGIGALHIGGPGSGGSARFQGELAELRVYDRRLADAQRKQVEAELRRAWFEAGPDASAADPVAELLDELLSARGPYWLSADERRKRLPSEERARLDGMVRELEVLRKKPATEIPRAVAVQDGGPKGTRHEGFKDAPIFVRGNHKRPGKTVPRGFPRVLTGGHPPRITEGSGRRQLSDWLARPDNPLTARVMVNRIWQHHFGEGLVRTVNDFGNRGEHPSHPALLDLLAARFVASGWSLKAMHRMILLSATYQQGTRADAAAIAADPENRLFGRMIRRRLDAEAIRDGMLAAAGRLDRRRGGPAFADLAVPRRTVYLMSVRTGPTSSASDFGRLFDRADPGSIVGQRGQSVVAPQALFFLNDPFVNDQARALAARLAREEPVGVERRIRRLYALTLGRPPSAAEIDLGRQLLSPDGGLDPWERYCQVVLGCNEMVYLD